MQIWTGTGLEIPETDEVMSRDLPAVLVVRVHEPVLLVDPRVVRVDIPQRDDEVGTAARIGDIEPG